MPFTNAVYGTDYTGVTSGVIPSGNSNIDPYIPLTPLGFIECIDQLGSYVMLTQDIMFNEDPTYRDWMTLPLTIKCTELWGRIPQTGESLIKVNGVKIRSENTTVKTSGFMRVYTDDAVTIKIHHINFSNCVLNSSVGSKIPFMCSTTPTGTSGTQYRWSVEDCNFTILINSGQYIPVVFSTSATGTAATGDNSKCSLSRCSIFVKNGHTNILETLNSPFSYPLDSCCVQLSNFATSSCSGSSSPSTSSLIPFFLKSTNCLIFGDIVGYDISASITSDIRKIINTILLETCSDCIVAIINLGDNPSDKPFCLSSRRQTSGTPSSNCLCVSDSGFLPLTEYVSGSTSFSQGFTALSSTDIKNETVLENIGFLP